MSERGAQHPTYEAKRIDADQFAADIAYINRLMEPVCGERGVRIEVTTFAPALIVDAAITGVA